MAKYTFSLDKFDIYNTMARHTDSDYVYFSGTVGTQVMPPIHQFIGDLNNGDFVLNWELGPNEMQPGEAWSFHYMIVNHGHSDDSTRVKNDVEIADKVEKVLAYIANGVGLVYPPAAIVGTVLKELAGAGEALAWLISTADPNCDGIVLQDAVSGTTETLEGWTRPTGTHSETRNYEGPQTPSGCGSNAQYSVTWSALWPEKPKESKEGKEHKEGKEGKEKEHGHQENAPVQTAAVSAAGGRSPYRRGPFDVTSV